MPHEPFTRDVQAERPDLPLSLDSAGVRGVERTLEIADLGPASASFDLTCDLGPGQRGVHMSRFAEAASDAIAATHGGGALDPALLVGGIASQVLGMQDAASTRVRMQAQVVVNRTTPVTGLNTHDPVTVIAEANASVVAPGAAPAVRTAVGVRVPGITACPCAQSMAAERARDVLREQGLDDSTIDTVLDSVPMPTHNQRAEAELTIATNTVIPVRALIDIASASMSAPVHDLLKREDELEIVWAAHQRPRFVEDTVRELLERALNAGFALADSDLVTARQTNFETIHAHEAIAARSGLVRDLRAELAGNAAIASKATAESKLISAWLTATPS